jgi:hypothetical protein
MKLQPFYECQDSCCKYCHLVDPVQIPATGQKICIKNNLSNNFFGKRIFSNFTSNGKIPYVLI